MIVYAVKYSDDVLVEALEFDGVRLWGVIGGAVVVTIGIMGIITGYFKAAFFKTLYTILLFLLIVILLGMIVSVLLVRQRVNNVLYSVDTCLDLKSLGDAEIEIKQATKDF